MNIEKLSEFVSVSAQIKPEDVKNLAELGVEVLVCNRPDQEEAGQIAFAEIEQEAKKYGIESFYLPFTAGNMTSKETSAFANLLTKEQSIHAYCRTGNRSKKLWQAASAASSSDTHGLDASKFDIVIIGAGSGGIATASSLKKRQRHLRIAIIDPSNDHYYQPAWTMVGGGAFDIEQTKRNTLDVIPEDCEWLQYSVVDIQGKNNAVVLSNGTTVYYSHLVVAPGLQLNWGGIEGLEETLGKNGVTSNYRFDLAPYTWELVTTMKKGKAIFTQPAMPIKCAGAPQKAMYLSASEWLRKGKLDDINIQFYNSGAALFGVEAYVPALMEYVKKYKVELCFKQTLFKVDGEKKIAYFKNEKGEVSESQFDFIHVCPPQRAPDFIRESELSDDKGWLVVDAETLQSTQYPNIWGVGDVLNTTNAKTMAAVRKQAPVVAQNIVAALASSSTQVAYNGYGSCPLMVEHGKVVLAEFCYGGELDPTFPAWLNKGTQPTSFAWFLKASILPYVYWHGMLKGKEWLASPKAKAEAK